MPAKGVRLADAPARRTCLRASLRPARALPGHVRMSRYANVKRTSEASRCRTSRCAPSATTRNAWMRRCQKKRGPQLGRELLQRPRGTEVVLNVPAPSNPTRSSQLRSPHPAPWRTPASANAPGFAEAQAVIGRTAGRKVDTAPDVWPYPDRLHKRTPPPRGVQHPSTTTEPPAAGGTKAPQVTLHATSPPLCAVRSRIVGRRGSNRFSVDLQRWDLRIYSTSRGWAQTRLAVTR
jgi:hypothetical protein